MYSMNMEKIITIGAYALMTCVLVSIIVANTVSFMLTQETRAAVEAKEAANRSLAISNIDELIRCHSVGGMVRATDEGTIECSDSVGITKFQVIID